MEPDVIRVAIQETRDFAYWLPTIAQVGAALITLFLAAIAFTQIRRDRVWLVVRADVRDFLIRDGEVVAQDKLMVFATNVGRRPAFITGVGAKIQRPELPYLVFGMSGAALPFRLDEGECYEGRTAAPASTPDQFRQVYVVDTHGRRWQAPKKDVRRINEELAKMRQAEQRMSAQIASSSSENGAKRDTKERGQ